MPLTDDIIGISLRKGDEKIMKETTKLDEETKAKINKAMNTIIDNLHFLKSVANGEEAKERVYNALSAVKKLW